MKQFRNASLFLATYLLLTGCGQSFSTTTPEIPAPTAITSITIPSPGEIATATAPSTATRAPAGQPSLVPTTDPTQIPDLLSKAFSIKTLDGNNGHAIRKITGLDPGFRRRCDGYQWLDSNHLMIFPLLGQEMTNNFGVIDETLAVIINNDTGKFWYPSHGPSWQCDPVPWSAKLGILILPDFMSEKEGASTFTPDGDLLEHYQGKLTGVSPSGTRILMEDDTWIDLSSHKVVDFAWDLESDQLMYFPHPIWSTDEMRVYTCCYHYGDARTGESYNFPFNDLTIDGEKTTESLFHSYGQWVLNNSYLLVQWDFFYDSNPGFIPLIDFKARTLRNLSKLAGIPTDFSGQPNCQQTSASPNGLSVWAECYTGDYLIDLSSFESKAYPDYKDVDINWSTDGTFAWVNNLQDDSSEVLSVISKELKPLLPKSSLASTLSWHPIENVLAYISEDGQRLELLDAQTMSVREIELPLAFDQIIWSPTGEHIALVAEDGSLWQVDYPKLEKLEQLTSAMLDIRDVRWSPNSAYLAFIGGTNIYIVATSQ